MSFREPSGAPDTTAEPTTGAAPTHPEPAAGRPATTGPATTGPATAAPGTAGRQSSAAPPRGRNMLPERERRRFGAERLLVRLVATCGIVGIGVALGAILVSSNVEGWITGLVVAGVSVVLSAILWSSRQV